MNIFSAEKWKKYTGVQSINLSITFEGKIKVFVYALSCVDEKIVISIIMEEEMDSSSKSSKCTSRIELPAKGVIGVTVDAEEKTVFYEGSYDTDEVSVRREINIGISICTFKREKYVERNMNVLKEHLLNNEEAQAYGHLSVCISDNGGTLEKEKIEDSDIRIVENKNLGGVGGFTRTMFEHLRDDKITHVLLMDDDAVISPEAIERTYTLLTILKDEYTSATIGGTLLREDKTESDKTKKALNDARAKGVKVVLSSGRPIEGLYKYLEELDLIKDGEYVLSYNGSLVHEVKSKNIIASKTLLG